MGRPLLATCVINNITPRLGPQTPAQPLAAPSPDSSAEPSGPRAMVAVQSTHAAHVRASGPLGPTRPQASSLAGRQGEGSGSRQPEVCTRAYISRQLFLPQATRKPGGPGLPLPRLVKPAQPAPQARMPPTAPACHRGSTVPKLPPWGPAGGAGALVGPQAALQNGHAIPPSGGQQAGQWYLPARIHCSHPLPKLSS